MSGEHRIGGCAEIGTGHRTAIAGTTVVELSAVDEAPFTIEEKQVRRAGGLEGFRHIL